jgi:hypothetical protein
LNFAKRPGNWWITIESTCLTSYPSGPAGAAAIDRSDPQRGSTGAAPQGYVGLKTAFAADELD